MIGDLIKVHVCIENVAETDCRQRDEDQHVTGKNRDIDAEANRDRR